MGCGPWALLALLCGAAGAAAPLRCNVSLDSPAEQRWLPVLRHFEPAFLRAAVRRIIDERVPKWVHQVIQPIAAQLEVFMPQPFAGEIVGMCKALGVDLGDGILLNFAYESTAFCTSIVAQDDKGNIYHGRNLDYAFVDILSKITVDVQFLKGGQVAYQGTTFLGYVGLWTGQSPHRFTISGNEREGGSWWENAIAAFLNRNYPVSWLVRDTLSEAEDFQSAVLRLASIPIIAEVYYIVGGVSPKEGMVITRNRRGPADLWPLNPLGGEWFRVETNYDHWTTPPPCDDRRTAAIKALNATGQHNINFDTLFKVYETVLDMAKKLRAYADAVHGPTHARIAAVETRLQTARCLVTADHFRWKVQEVNPITLVITLFQAQTHLLLHMVLSVKPVLNNNTVYTTVMSAALPDRYQTWMRGEE